MGEDVTIRSRRSVQRLGSTMQRPPLSLDPYYLITPFFTDAVDRQIVLGKMMQVRSEGPTVECPDLIGSDLHG